MSFATIAALHATPAALAMAFGVALVLSLLAVEEAGLRRGRGAGEAEG